MLKTKYALDEIMTIAEAAERYNINYDTLKNKFKPSIAGSKQIEKWINEGIIKQSGKTWLLTSVFIEKNFKNF